MMELVSTNNARYAVHDVDEQVVASFAHVEDALAHSRRLGSGHSVVRASDNVLLATTTKNPKAPLLRSWGQAC